VGEGPDEGRLSFLGKIIEERKGGIHIKKKKGGEGKTTCNGTFCLKNRTNRSSSDSLLRGMEKGRGDHHKRQKIRRLTKKDWGRRRY